MCQPVFVLDGPESDSRTGKVCNKLITPDQVYLDGSNGHVSVSQTQSYLWLVEHSKRFCVFWYKTTYDNLHTAVTGKI